MNNYLVLQGGKLWTVSPFWRDPLALPEVSVHGNCSYCIFWDTVSLPENSLISVQEMVTSTLALVQFAWKCYTINIVFVFWKPRQFYGDLGPANYTVFFLQEKHFKMILSRSSQCLNNVPEPKRTHRFCETRATKTWTVRVQHVQYM
jgi:hypothetical protein